MSSAYAEAEPKRAELDQLAGPTLVFLRDGSEVARMVRPRDAGAIREALERISARQ